MSDLEIKEWCLEENRRECEEYEEHRKSELLRQIERNKEILKRDFGIEFK